MIIVLNGYPGVGKLTIAQELAARLSARLLDIHTVYNVAFALTTFKSPEFVQAVEKIEAIAHDLILKLPDDVPVVLTTVLAGSSDWGDAEWQRIVQLERQRGPLYVVHVLCDLDENIRRITAEGRAAKRKPRDVEMAERNHTQALPLAGADEANLLTLNVTRMTAVDAAASIEHWLS